ncbi:carbon-nitrogen family hydrolase [Desulfobotulus sp. H1]|uniref:Carbon-nitrogen family hydrolase n=1 Tax=Desulfobotulus pelophilus TaxID=2823377 RepID=A0ABT3N633_9BACT|nr:carbon-nitrogen family hydrolase [Desulfobotulus pelophilus]MCW7752920.1 carbon-nitrogen family hydrolase [Desulfobotulus pelophilus]
MERVNASVVQFDVQRDNRAGNRAFVMDALEQCLPGLAVLPEMWACGFDYKNLAAHALATEEILADLSAVARRRNLVIVGSLPVLEGSRVYNVAHVVDADGRVAGSYKKIHLFTAGGEGKGFAAGDRADVCETSLGPLGVMICYDLRFPELARTLMGKGARILAVPAQWPTARRTHWRTLVRARAIENQLFVVGANRCGEDGELRYPGGSLIVSPTDQILADPGEKAGVFTAELDFSLMNDYRNTIPCLKERRPEVYAR